jgi:DNA-binding CsgD family transcriptional regulator
MMNSRAVHFWVNETGEQFARWLERETRHWSGASLPLELSLDPYICAFEPFKAAPDLLSVSTRWGLDARGKDATAQPADTRGTFTFRLDPHGRNGERLHVTFWESRPFEPCEEDGLDPVAGSPLARAVERIEDEIGRRLDALFATIEHDWPEAAGKIVPVWQALPQAGQEAPVADPIETDGPEQASPAAPPITLPSARDMTERRAKVKAYLAEGLNQKQIAGKIPCHRRTVGTDVAWLKAHGEIEGYP